jgi:hypothetical protein
MNNHSVPGFWDKYIAISRLYKVKESALRWYVRHTETYIAAFEEAPITEHEAEHVETYLRDKGRNPGIQSWQFLQIVQALEILFVEMVQAPWAGDYAWRDWASTAQTLPDNHATLSRACLPLTNTEIDEDASEEFSLSRKVAHLFPQLVEALITQIRVRHYSIRTEQAYLGWFCRFVAHNGMKNPAELGEQHISDFIEQLTVRRNVAASTQGQALSAPVFFYRQVLGRETWNHWNFPARKNSGACRLC